MAAAVAVAVLAVIALALGPPVARTPDWMVGDGEPVPQPVITPPDLGQSPISAVDPTVDVETSLDIPALWPLAAILGVSLLAWLAWYLRRYIPDMLRRRAGRRVLGVTVDDVAPDLHGAARRARHMLIRPGVPGHEAVIAAWITVEEAAAESGAPRRPTETPSEFTSRLLSSQHADPDATTRLLALYHRARFAADPRLSTDDIATAAAALDTIVDSIDNAREPSVSAGDARR